MITTINEFKTYITEQSKYPYGSIKIHDMVYVDAYGPMTYGFNDMKSDNAFSPRLYNFDLDTKYEVVYVTHNPGGGEIMYVGLYDNDNEYQEINPEKISLDTLFTNPNINK